MAAHPAFIIHRSERTRRQPLVNALIRAHHAALCEAVVPAWEPDRDARAVRGCALSHLAIIESVRADYVLVFEDDALVPAEPVDLPEVLPDDCGALLLGGWADAAVAVPGLPDLYRVIGPWRGSHAILYHLKALRRTPFLYQAYRTLARTRCGSAEGIVYESLLLSSLTGSGLSLLRPESLPYGTDNRGSDRVTEDTPAPSLPLIK